MNFFFTKNNDNNKFSRELTGLSFQNVPINCGKRLGTGSFGTVYIVAIEKSSEQQANSLK